MPTSTQSQNWKAQAKAILESGEYVPGAWESMLRRHLSRCFPELCQELRRSGDMESYVVVMTEGAAEMYSDLVQRGTPPEIAREAALALLLQVPEDETES